jgi:hypothetical protein
MLTSVKVLQSATLPAGLKLRLVESQAQPRALRLKIVGKGLYEVQEPVQFKAGEVIDVDMTGLPKSLRDQLYPIQAAAKVA